VTKKGSAQVAHAYEIRVGACADYLLGVKIEVIARKWGIADSSLIASWITKRKCFKLRRPRKRMLSLS